MHYEPDDITERAIEFSPVTSPESFFLAKHKDCIK
jgi:hypothetical protein